jgi:hypothetical protein
MPPGSRSGREYAGVFTLQHYYFSLYKGIDLGGILRVFQDVTSPVQTPAIRPGCRFPLPMFAPHRGMHLVSFDRVRAVQFNGGT